VQVDQLPIAPRVIVDAMRAATQVRATKEMPA
jgi:hypothetical protein